MASVIIKNLFKSFGQKTVLEGINLDIKDGEFCVLVGPSGCGKSTLLRIIAGLEIQDSNKSEIFIDGNLVNEVPPKNRDIAFVFQSYALYPHLNVYDNIAFSLKIKKTPKEKIAEKVNRTAQMLGLEELLKRKPKELSGGQRQRVALGRAIVREPKIFLMDEPLSNLDAKLRVQMRSEIKKLQQTLGTTCIYVTHDQVEALTMGDRIVVLDGGKIQQIDSPQNIYEKPKNTFVATFMGSMPMNIIEVENKDGIIEIKETGNKEAEVYSNELDLNNYPFLKGKNKVLLGFRPEDTVSKDEVSDNKNFFKFGAKIDFVESLGSYKIAYFHINNAKCCAKIPQNAETEGIYEFFAAKNNLHFFDSETKNSLA